MRSALKEARVSCDGLHGISDEHPEAYDSQANGSVENGIRNFRAHFRTLRACLQRRIAKAMPVNSPALAWLVEHTCLVMNAVVLRRGGVSAWTRARGRPFRQRLVGFGETCLWKLPPKGPQHDAAGNMSARWKLGVFLGYDRLMQLHLQHGRGQ